MSKDLSMLPPHQLRVVEEAKELRTKYEALVSFIDNSPIFLSLDSEEKKRLQRQSTAMKTYFDILTERINSF